MSPQVARLLSGTAQRDDPSPEASWSAAFAACHPVLTLTMWEEEVLQRLRLVSSSFPPATASCSAEHFNSAFDLLGVDVLLEQ
jgi:hypothetical protein